jgi:para-aminobenzoate synthetase/4-amino-4-deoxychorismate lyase
MSGERPDPGRGVFETLLLAGGRVHALEAHLQRLDRSVRQLYGMSVPEPARTRLVDTLTGAARVGAERRARIDAAPRDGQLDLRLVLAQPPAGRPVALAPVVVPGGLGAHKWQDRRLVERPGEHPVPLIVDEDGSVLEAAWANVWMLEGDCLITPPADGRLLPGVTRARLLALAPHLGLHPREEPIRLADARTARTIFLTSSLRLAVPASFDPHPQESPAVDRIRDALACC